MKLNSKVKNLLYFPISLVFLYLMFRKYTQFLDISMVDETGYMELLNFNPLIYPGGYGPLYILSYKIVFQIVPDFIQLHYFFIITLTWLPAVAIFYFLRSRKVSFVVALLSSWLLFISTYIAAFDWWARTAHYSIFACFVFLIFTYRYKQKPIVFLAFAFFFLKILSYVRPELNVASYLILLLLLVLVIYKKVKKQELHINISFLEKSILGIFALVFLGMFLIWKSPTQNTGRLYFALGQHYKFNTIRWNNEERKEFINWEETFKKQFGESKNLQDMYKANPKETTKHVLYNVKHYLQQTLDFTTELFLPKSIFKFNFIFKYVLFVVVFVLLVIKLGTKKYIQALKQKIIDEYLFLYFAAVFALPSLLASFVIYPREHYYIMQVVFIIYLIYILLSPFKDLFQTQKNINLIYAIIAIVIVFACTPHVSKYKRYNNFYTYTKPNYLPYIQTIRNLKIDSITNFLSFEILPVYLGKNFKGYPYFMKKPFYDSIIVQQNIDMLYVSDAIIDAKQHQTDSQFHFFMNNYQNLGWQKIQLKDKNGYLILKNELLTHDSK